MVPADDVRTWIDEASDFVGLVWPVHSFVTANPLGGLEDQPFHDAVDRAAEVVGASGYPDVETFRLALEEDAIDEALLEERLTAVGFDGAPDESLEVLSEADRRGANRTPAAWEPVHDILTDWLAAFLDEGSAEWSMPGRERGFYGAVRQLAPHDADVPGIDAPGDWPETAVDAVCSALTEVDADRRRDVVRRHLAALPGWVGFIRRRIRDDGPWQQQYPISLEGYLAVRLLLTDHLDAPVDPNPGEESPEVEPAESTERDLRRAWLEAWEETYRDGLLDALADQAAEPGEEAGRPDAQLVFCIDTRSEVIRRHVEAQGQYETHGYAGFFGVPMRYSGYDSEVAVDACPPILEPEHRIEDAFDGDHAEPREERDFWHAVWNAGARVVKAMKSNPATAFSFVESAGSLYGGLLAGRTLWPQGLRDAVQAADEAVADDPEFCDPTIDSDAEADGELPKGMTLDEQVDYAAAAFELMGWQTFGRLVVFVGHAGETANNPHDSGLDCGACAGNPGGPSARVLATICNRDAVRERLHERGIEIPDDTFVVAGQHNTTTDEVELFAYDIPESHRDDLEALRRDLEAAREGAASERADAMGNDPTDAVRETERRASDWSETRPEWGLAGNASFIVGPRSLSYDLNLDGRAFLHSYDWRADSDGDALAEIMAGPMVVTQWINAQYYFSTVDPALFGSETKVTHNPVGNVGVYQGNGGDVMAGLPLQSVRADDQTPFHEPIRLMTVIQAPTEWVDEILREHDDLAELLDNGWLDLAVLDPQRGNEPVRYKGEGEWSEPFERTADQSTERDAPSPTPMPEPVGAE